MTIIDTHISHVQHALTEEYREQWDAIEGASEQELAQLLAHYPQCPQTLIALLRKIGGTYHHHYPKGTVSIPILGSDISSGFIYYLLSCEDMIKERRYSETITERYGEFLSDPEIIEVAPEIDINVPMSQWLCFAHCINNGGTSILYLDFSPTKKGTVGQVVRYLHDPDSYVVLAPSFEEYMVQRAKRGYDSLEEF